MQGKKSQRHTKVDHLIPDASLVIGLQGPPVILCVGEVEGPTLLPWTFTPDPDSFNRREGQGCVCVCILKPSLEIELTIHELHLCHSGPFVVEWGLGGL